MDQDELPWTLFVVLGDGNSERAIRLSEKCADVVRVVDVSVLKQKNAIPTWLKGVPTVLDRANWKLYKGAAALRVLEELSGSPGGDAQESESTSSKSKVTSEDVQHMVEKRQRMEPPAGSIPPRPLTPPIAGRD